MLFMRLLKLLEWKWKLGGLGGELDFTSQSRKISVASKLNQIKKKENHLEYLWIFMDQKE